MNLTQSKFNSIRKNLNKALKNGQFDREWIFISIWDYRNIAEFLTKRQRVIIVNKFKKYFNYDISYSLEWSYNNKFLSTKYAKNRSICYNIYTITKER